MPGQFATNFKKKSNSQHHFVTIKGDFHGKIIFCFLSEKESLDGMEPVYIFYIMLRHKHPVIEL